MHTPCAPARGVSLTRGVILKRRMISTCPCWHAPRIHGPSKRRLLMENRNAYVDKMEGQLKIWRAKLDEMVGRSQKTAADVRIETNKRLEALKEKLEELKAAGADKWE